MRDWNSKKKEELLFDYVTVLRMEWKKKYDTCGVRNSPAILTSCECEQV